MGLGEMGQNHKTPQICSITHYIHSSKTAVSNLQRTTWPAHDCDNVTDAMLAQYMILCIMKHGTGSDTQAGPKKEATKFPDTNSSHCSTAKHLKKGGIDSHAV